MVIKEKPIEKIKASFSNPWDGTIDDTDNEKDKSNGSVNGSVNNRTSIDSLSEFEKIIFLIIKDNQNINNKKKSELTQMPYRTTARYLKSLRDKGLIEFVGSAKTGGYRITFIMT